MSSKHFQYSLSMVTGVICLFITILRLKEKYKLNMGIN